MLEGHWLKRFAFLGWFVEITAGLCDLLVARGAHATCTC
jgi:hypothetical protein